MQLKIQKDKLRDTLFRLETKLLDELKEIRQTRIDAPHNKGNIYLDGEVSHQARRVNDLLHILYLDEQTGYVMLDEYVTLEDSDLWMIMSYRDRVFPAPRVAIEEDI